MFKFISKMFKGNKSGAKEGEKSETKSTTSSSVFLDSFTQNLLYSHDYTVLAKRGYMENVIAFHCINQIATSAQNIPVDLCINGKEVELNTNDRLAKSLLLNLKSPNTEQTGKQLTHEVLSHRLIQGEYFVYTEKTSTNTVLDTESLRPDRISKITAGNDKIVEFIYSNGSQAKTFQRNEDNYFDLLFFKTFNPMSDINGLSPISAGGMSLEQYNNANTWNKGLFDNGSKLSGIFSFDDSGDGFEALEEQDVIDFADDLNKKFRSRQGGIAVLNAKGKLETMALNPTEMDFIEGQKAKAIEICNALNYPPYLLGIEGATFNNQKEAKESLYEEAVLPILQEYYELLSVYHTRLFDQNIEYKLDLKGVSALAEKRERMRESARKDYQGGIIFLNEARRESGRDDVEMGDDIWYGDMRQNDNDFNNNSNNE